QRKECLGECVNHLVVERPALGWQRMRDERDTGRRGYRRIDDNFERADRTVDHFALGRLRRQMRSLSTILPPTTCESMISSMSSRSKYVYQTASGYTTTIGPSWQRSRQPALLMRISPLPARPSALIRSFAYFCISSAPDAAQHRSGGSRLLQQKKT